MLTKVKAVIIIDEEYSYYDDNIDDVFFEKL